MAMFVEIEFDKPRRLRFDLSAIEDFEAANNGQPLGLLVNNLNNLGLTALKLALWAGLRHEDQALTPNLVRRMLQQHLDDGKPLSQLTEPLNKAILQSGLFGKSLDVPGNGQPEAVTTSSPQS